MVFHIFGLSGLEQAAFFHNLGQMKEALPLNSLFNYFETTPYLIKEFNQIIVSIGLLPDIAHHIIAKAPGRRAGMADGGIGDADRAPGLRHKRQRQHVVMPPL